MFSPSYERSRTSVVIEQALSLHASPHTWLEPKRMRARRFPLDVHALEPRLIPGPRYNDQIGIPVKFVAPDRKPTFIWLRFTSSGLRFADESTCSSDVARGFIYYMISIAVFEAQAYFHSKLWC